MATGTKADRGSKDNTARGAEGTALVTGASSGIGRELARVFAEKGWDLVVVARRRERLEKLAEELESEHQRKVRVVAMDLLAPGAPAQLYGEMARAGIQVDVLVNNAGVGEVGGFLEQSLESLERVIELNARVLTSLTHLFVTEMVKRKRGWVLNVASVASFQPIPSLAVYAATKAYVLSLTEALSEELARTGVHIAALCPGLTTTELFQHSLDVIPDVGRFTEGLAAKPTDVAREGYAACMSRRVVAVPGLANRVFTDFARFQPRWLVRTVGGLVGRQLIGRRDAEPGGHA